MATERKRLTLREPVFDGGVGRATIVDAVFENDHVVVFDLEGHEIARSDVRPGDDPWVIAKRLLPRPRQPDFWRPMPPGPGVPY